MVHKTLHGKLKIAHANHTKTGVKSIPPKGLAVPDPIVVPVTVKLSEHLVHGNRVGR